MVFMKDHKEIVKERVSTYIICLKWDEKYMPNILVLIEKFRKRRGGC